MVSDNPRTRSGLIRIRFSKKGVPYVLISREDARLLSDLSPDWLIKLDYAGNPPLVILPVSDSVTVPLRSSERVVRSVRLDRADWEWFKRKCRDERTTTCREVRKWIHLAREEEMFPTTLKRGRGLPGSYVG